MSRVASLRVKYQPEQASMNSYRAILEATLHKLVVCGLFLLPLIPLLITPFLYYQDGTGKAFAFRVIVEIITFLWLALAMSNKEYRPRRSVILVAFALFVVIMAIADAFGVDPFKSFWSTYERMDGWITLVHVFAVTLVASSVLSSEKMWRWLFNVSLSTSAVVALYGFLQLLQYVPLENPASAWTGWDTRIDSTIGNAGFLGMYLLLHVFLALLLLVQTWKTHPRARGFFTSFAYALVIVLDTGALLFTGTRGAILAFILGVITCLSVLSFRLASRRIRIISAVVLIAIISLGISVKFMGNGYLVEHVGFLQRLSSISLQDATIKARMINMEIAWHGVEERPLFGWGQENYAVVFDRYYDPRMYGQEPWFDRVHNVLFDWLIAGGILGLLGYLSIFISIFWILFKRDAFPITEQSILIGLFVAYLFADLTLFDTITGYIIVGLILGYLVWRTSDHDSRRWMSALPVVKQQFLAFLVPAMVLCAIGGVWLVNADAFVRSYLLEQALSPHEEGVLTNLNYFKEALRYKSYGTEEIRQALADVALVVVTHPKTAENIKQAFFTTTSAELEQQIKDSPLDARAPYFLGQLYDLYGDYSDGARVLQYANKLSPNKQSILSEMALNADARGDKVSALQYLQKSFDLDRNNDDARAQYAMEAISVGDTVLADDLLEPMLNKGSIDPRIIRAYFLINRIDKIIQTLEPYVQNHPGDSKAGLALAAAYYLTGDKVSAVRTIEALEKAVPSAKYEADVFINQINGALVPTVYIQDKIEEN